jgi:hypothetical protein
MKTGNGNEAATDNPPREPVDIPPPRDPSSQPNPKPLDNPSLLPDPKPIDDPRPSKPRKTMTILPLDTEIERLLTLV